MKKGDIIELQIIDKRGFISFDHKKIKDAEEMRDAHYKAGGMMSFNHYIGYIQAMYEMKELLRKRKSRER